MRVSYTAMGSLNRLQDGLEKERAVGSTLKATNLLYSTGIGPVGKLYV